jgi:copper chaperone CopZ
MTDEIFNAANIKCDGCATTIHNGLMELPGVSEVEVDVASGRVRVNGVNLDRQRLSDKLSELGYPEIIQ